MEIGSLREDNFQVEVQFLDATVLVRYIPAEELRMINKQATRHVWDRHQRMETLDTNEANRLLGRAAVRGWDGFTMKGEAFPYSPENCDFFMLKWVEFAKFVNDICIDLATLVRAKKEESIKNSVSTSVQD